jgi:hypothetical protein
MNLVGDETMGLSVDSFGSFSIWRLNKAKDCSVAFIKPILFVPDAVFGLRLDVFHVSFRDGCRGDPLYFLVNVHKEWHLDILLFSLTRDFAKAECAEQLFTSCAIGSKCHKGLFCLSPFINDTILPVCQCLFVKIPYEME